jgi:hypothetical protein
MAAIDRLRAHLLMQDGCNRSAWGTRRVNVFVDSHHSDVRKRHSDLHCLDEATETHIDLSSTGLKIRTGPFGLKRHVSPPKAAAPGAVTAKVEAGCSSFK